MVWIRFHDGVSDERIASHLEGLAGLAERVPGIVALSVGPNLSPGRSGGFTHGLYVRLESEAALRAYGPHPEHQRVAAALQQDAELAALDIAAEP